MAGTRAARRVFRPHAWRWFTPPGVDAVTIAPKMSRSATLILFGAMAMLITRRLAIRRVTPPAPSRDDADIG